LKLDEFILYGPPFNINIKSNSSIFRVSNKSIERRGQIVWKNQDSDAICKPGWVFSRWIYRSPEWHHWSGYKLTHTESRDILSRSYRSLILSVPRSPDNSSLGNTIRRCSRNHEELWGQVSTHNAHYSSQPAERLEAVPKVKESTP
jgi:hypothetical protein